MLTLYCFNQNDGTPETGRMICQQDRRPDVRRPNAANIPGWVGYSGGGETPDYAKKDRTSGSVRPLEPLRKAVEARKDLKELPRPVTPRAKEKLRKRTVTDIFGTKETQDWYVEKVGQAFDGLSEDALYKFIMEHQSYEKKADHESWNRDFAKLLGITIPPKYQGPTEAMTNRRITAAVQIHLVDKYWHDIFQETMKAPNPWIFIDGRMGPYTVSVLAEYWKKKFGPTSKKKPPTRAGVAGEYTPESPGAKLYNDGAMPYLDATIAAESAMEESDNEEITPEEARKDVDAKAKYARLDEAPAGYAFSNVVFEKRKMEGGKKNLSQALSSIYEEDPTKAKKSPKTFRVLNLLATRVGAEVDEIAVDDGDFLEINADGTFLLTDSDGEELYNINLLKPPAEPEEEDEDEGEEDKDDNENDDSKEDEPAPEESDDEVKKRLAEADKGTIDNKTQLPIDHELKEDYFTLGLALSEAYAGKGADKEAFVNRVMNLVAQKLGAKIKDIKLTKGNVIEIKADGSFTIYKKSRSFKGERPVLLETIKIFE